MSQISFPSVKHRQSRKALYSIECGGFAGAFGFPQRASLPARLGINTCLSGLRPENPSGFQQTAVPFLLGQNPQILPQQRASRAIHWEEAKQK